MPNPNTNHQNLTMNKMVQPIYDKVLVEVSGMYNNEATILGSDGQPVKLFIPIKNYEGNLSTSHKITCGKAVKVCHLLKKDLRNVVYNAPEPIPKLTDLFYDGCNYRTQVEIKEGDKVYFHYNTLTEETCYHKLPNGNEVHIIDYHRIFCYVRGVELHACEGFSLLEQVYEEEVQTIEHEGTKMDVVMSESGIVLDTKPKKEKRKAVLAYHGAPLKKDSKEDAKPGDVVILAPNKNFSNHIEGKDYYVTKHDGLYGKIVDDKIIPYGDYLVIKPEYIETEIYLEKKIRSNTGTVLRKGPKVPEDIEIGDVIHFAKESKSFFYWDEENEELLVKNSFVLGKGQCKVELNSKSIWSEL